MPLGLDRLDLKGRLGGLHGAFDVPVGVGLVTPGFGADLEDPLAQVLDALMDGAAAHRVGRLRTLNLEDPIGF